MEFKIVLVVRHVDLDDDATIEKLALSSLDNLIWHEERGNVFATLLTEAPNPVDVALAAARAIEGALPGAVVERADEQLVALGDIAVRTGLSHEAVRLWATGKRRAQATPFPAPYAEVGQGKTATKIWTWADVLAWLRTQYSIDPEPGLGYLSAGDLARLNAGLHDQRIPGARWTKVGIDSVTRVLSAVDDCLEETVMVRRFAAVGR